MLKKIAIPVALCCLVVAIAAAVFLFSPTPQKIDIDRDLDPAPTGPVPQALTRSFNEDSGSYSVAVEYPELQGISASGVREKVNGAIKAGVYNQIAVFQSANASNLPLGEPDLKSSLDGSFDVSLLTRSFFSGLMSYSDYSAGAAHPGNYLAALNYDLRSGEAVTLDKLLRGLDPSGGYMARLGAYVKKDLVRQLGDSQDAIDTINLGAAPTAENYANFTLDAAGLTIHFESYQVASGAAGPQVVDVPYKYLLDSVVRSTGADAGATSSVTWWLQ
jgi:hypothetical protein